MKDKELRKLIGSRAKQRRLELGVNQPYIAEKMGVTASTIQRYEAGTIDNTKKLVLDGLSEALHVSVEWLKGETEEMTSDVTDKRELQIRDTMTSILSKLPYDMKADEADFSKDLLLLMLKEYELFVDSFQYACKNFKGNTEDATIAKVMGFESNQEYNEIMFLRENHPYGKRTERHGRHCKALFQESRNGSRKACKSSFRERLRTGID